MATARMRTLPDFLIIGAQRCGTTSLYNYLVEHPSVSPAFMKETHFFDFNFHKGVNWYRAFFPSAGLLSSPYQVPLQARHSDARPPGQRSDGRRQRLTGESTPYYLFYPHAPRRVKETIPGVKLIVLLRNPVDRAYSHYHHEVRTGAEKASFEDALERERETMPREVAKIREDARYTSFSHVHHAYLSRGIYVDQLQPWVELFGRERMIIISSEDFYADPATAVGQVFDFLGMPGWTSSRYKKYNEAQYDRMDTAIRDRLIAYYKPHNQRLYEYLDRERIPIRLDWEN
jgi:hypothetical protein